MGCLLYREYEPSSNPGPHNSLLFWLLMQNSKLVKVRKNIQQGKWILMIWYECNSICFTLNPLEYLFIFQLTSKIPHWKSFEDSLCSEANHIRPITAWPVAAVGVETEWVMCYPFKSNFSHANAWHMWLCRALSRNSIFEKRGKNQGQSCVTI